MLCIYTWSVCVTPGVGGQPRAALDSRRYTVRYGVEYDAVCTLARQLRSATINLCKLSGPLPELRLPALQVLDNQWTGGLEPLRGYTARLGPRQRLQRLQRLTGDLEPLRGCTCSAARAKLARNRLKISLEPGGGATPRLHDAGFPLRTGNTLAGSLEPLQACTGLRMLDLTETQLVPTDEEKVHLDRVVVVVVFTKSLTRNIWPTG